MTGRSDPANRGRAVSDIFVFIFPAGDMGRLFLDM